MITGNTTEVGHEIVSHFAWKKGESGMRAQQLGRDTLFHAMDKSIMGKKVVKPIVLLVPVS